MTGGGEFSLIDLFQEEVRAHTAVISQGLLELEVDAANPQRIEPLMRGAHSIKGAARIIGIDLAVQLAHVMEDVFVAAQEGRIRIAPIDIDELLRGTDLLAELAGVADPSASAWTTNHTAEIADLRQRLTAVAQGQPMRVASAAPTAAHATLGSVRPSAAVDLGESSGATATQSQAQSSNAAICAPSWQMIDIPADPIVAGDDFPLLDLFREEVRGSCLAIQEGLLGLAENSKAVAPLESLASAARATRGAARIIGIGPAAQLAEAMEETFTVAFTSTKSFDASAWPPLHSAVEMLVELIAILPETVPEWIARRESDVAEACRLLSVARIDAPAAITQPAASSGATAQRNSGRDPFRSPETDARVQADASAVQVNADSTEAAPSAPQSATAAPVAAEPAAAVVRVSAQSLNRLMGLAGESLVQARWLQPFSTSLLKLKKHQDHLAGLLDSLSQTLPRQDAADEVAVLVDEVRRRTAHCRQVLAERMIEFEDHAAQAEDLNTRLYREVIVSRMRPFADGAHGFPRLVRDMARQLEKQVRLEIGGLDTEVDRDVLEKLEAPLTHLLRNAVDHGMEMPEERTAAGKPECGVIKLEVHHRAGMLAVTVSDDGRGLDPDRIRRKTIERGLTTAEMSKSMSTAEVLEFLFLPGFSTAEKLTEYSGRGVGLDVVQQAVRRIGGSVRVESRLGKGTTFHLQLPITLSVLRAVVVEVDGEPYAFPHNRIDRLIRVPATSLRSLENRQFLVVDGQNIGVVLAAQILGMKGTVPQTHDLTVVLVSDSVGQYGLIIDAFRGEQDLVVRPLDSRLGKVPNISAAAVLDDGSPVLIADVEDLIRSMDQYIQRGALQRYERESETRGPRKRVLVVDDSITVREVERQILRNQGYDVTVAVDGQDGWNMVRSEMFDLVISDVDMPRMNGLELVRLIRGEVSLRNMPVIIVSYKERSEDRLRGLEVGANYYLTKSSFHDDTFLQAVRDCVGEA
jgi:two-component system, chemotaxis family, sensor histidine kinase and response regulator WspE